MRLAFGVEGFLDSEIKDDANFVKYMVRLYGKKEGRSYERLLKYHKCSSEELKLFGDPSPESSALLERYKTEDRYLFCIEWDTVEKGDLAVWGLENDDNYQRWEFVLLPCNYMHAEITVTDDSIEDNCVRNKTE